MQKRPLLSAVEAGITSIEADLWLEEGKLLVGHDRGKWYGGFGELYLEPLAQLWAARKVPVDAGKTFLLWLDIKEDSAALRESLHKALEAHPFLHAVDADARIEVILTGKKVTKEAFVEAHPLPHVTRDSNTFLQDDPPGVPGWSWYALDWKKISGWDGVGEMPAGDRERLQSLVAQIHLKQRKLRLWNHPATLPFWREAVAAGVDRIGIDIIPGGK